MNWLLLLQIMQVIVSISLTILVLIQNRGKGLSSSISSGIQFYGSRRGLEKIVFITTVVLGISFVVNTFLILVLSS